jgi:integrase
VITARILWSSWKDAHGLGAGAVIAALRGLCARRSDHAAKQRGSVIRRANGWGVRYYNEQGERKRQGGFDTKSEAREWMDEKAKEVAALRRGDPSALRRREMPTLGELVDEYLGQHNAEANTLRTLTARLRYATKGSKLDGQGGWKDLRVDRLTVTEIGAWRRHLPERSAWAISKALRQVLHYAVRAKILDENVACLVPNPEPKRREVPTFGSVAELEAVAAELAPERAAIPLFVGLTGLRPEEWLALERGDIDRNARVVHVRRVYTDGQAKLYGKQTRSLRAVPLPLRAAQALDALPPRLDTRLLFPGVRGGHLNLHEWRADEWTPAVRAAGLKHRSPYALRHTYATFAIVAGVSLFELARFVGTSVDQIDKTYGHRLPDALDRTRQALDVFVGQPIVQEAQA